MYLTPYQGFWPCRKDPQYPNKGQLGFHIIVVLGKYFQFGAWTLWKLYTIDNLLSSVLPPVSALCFISLGMLSPLRGTRGVGRTQRLQVVPQ